MVHLMLAFLLHSHGWKLEDGVGLENLDMSEKFGLTLHKAQPLWAIDNFTLNVVFYITSQ